MFIGFSYLRRFFKFSHMHRHSVQGMGKIVLLLATGSRSQDAGCSVLECFFVGHDSVNRTDLPILFPTDAT